MVSSLTSSVICFLLRSTLNSLYFTANLKTICPHSFVTFEKLPNYNFPPCLSIFRLLLHMLCPSTNWHSICISLPLTFLRLMVLPCTCTSTFLERLDCNYLTIFISPGRETQPPTNSSELESGQKRDESRKKAEERQQVVELSKLNEMGGRNKTKAVGVSLRRLNSVNFQQFRQPKCKRTTPRYPRYPRTLNLRARV